MELLDAALQPHDVLVPSLDLTEGLLGNLGVNDLREATQDPPSATTPLQPSYTLLPSSLLLPHTCSPPSTRYLLPKWSSPVASLLCGGACVPAPGSLTPEVKMAGFPLSNISSSSSSVVFLPAL